MLLVIQISGAGLVLPYTVKRRYETHLIKLFTPTVNSLHQVNVSSNGTAGQWKVNTNLFHHFAFTFIKTMRAELNLMFQVRLQDCLKHWNNSALFYLLIYTYFYIIRTTVQVTTSFSWVLWWELIRASPLQAAQVGTRTSPAQMCRDRDRRNSWASADFGHGGGHLWQMWQKTLTIRSAKRDWLLRVITADPYYSCCCSS